MYIQSVLLVRRRFCLCTYSSTSRILFAPCFKKGLYHQKANLGLSPSGNSPVGIGAATEELVGTEGHTEALPGAQVALAAAARLETTPASTPLPIRQRLERRSLWHSGDTCAKRAAVGSGD
jgi:hypothetical protein